MTDVDGLNVHLAGPMTTFPHGNAEGFGRVASELRAKGAAVSSPHEMRDLEASPCAAAARRAAESVLSADLLVLLPGWEDSPGAALDALTATGGGVPVVTVDEVLV